MNVVCVMKYLLRRAIYSKKFRDHSVIVTNTYKLMEACNIDVDFHGDKTKQVYGGSTKDDRILLEKLTAAGFYRRYGKKNKTASQRFKRELQTILNLGFTAYIVINHDIVRLMQSQVMIMLVVAAVLTQSLCIAWESLNSI